eukprot:gene638-50_t
MVVLDGTTRVGRWDMVQGPPRVVDLPTPDKLKDKICVDPTQKDNRLLKMLKADTWQYGKTAADYQVSLHTMIIFVGLRWYAGNTKDKRAMLVSKMRVCKNTIAATRVVLCNMDGDGYSQPSLRTVQGEALQNLNLACFEHGWTLNLAFSFQECAAFVQAYLKYSGKASGEDVLKQPLKAGADKGHLPGAVSVLCQAGSTNKTDAGSLLSMHGSLARVFALSKDELLQGDLVHVCPLFFTAAQAARPVLQCPGLGPKKVQDLLEALHAPLDPGCIIKPKGPVPQLPQPRLDQQPSAPQLSAGAASQDPRQPPRLASPPALLPRPARNVPVSTPFMPCANPGTASHLNQVSSPKPAGKTSMSAAYVPPPSGALALPSPPNPQHSLQTQQHILPASCSKPSGSKSSVPSPLAFTSCAPNPAASTIRSPLGAPPSKRLAVAPQSGEVQPSFPAPTQRTRTRQISYQEGHAAMQQALKRSLDDCQTDSDDDTAPIKLPT